MLLAVLFCGLSTSFVACSDDDEKLSEEELRELEARRAQDPYDKESDGGLLIDRHDITQPIKGLEEVRTMYHPYVIKK